MYITFEFSSFQNEENVVLLPTKLRPAYDLQQPPPDCCWFSLRSTPLLPSLVPPLPADWSFLGSFLAVLINKVH